MFKHTASQEEGSDGQLRSLVFTCLKNLDAHSRSCFESSVLCGVQGHTRLSDVWRSCLRCLHRFGVCQLQEELFYEIR